MLIYEELMTVVVSNSELDIFQIPYTHSIAKKWASTDEAKEQMKKVQEAEKGLDKAKEDFKPYEKFAEEKPKEASK